MTKKLTMLMGGLVLSIGMALAQTTVTGKVVSQEDGEPVIGASIKIEGTKTGTVTDVDGNSSVSSNNPQNLFGQGWGSWSNEENGSYVKNNIRDFYQVGKEWNNNVSLRYGDEKVGIVVPTR